MAHSWIGLTDPLNHHKRLQGVNHATIFQFLAAFVNLHKLSIFPVSHIKYHIFISRSWKWVKLKHYLENIYTCRPNWMHLCCYIWKIERKDNLLLTSRSMFGMITTRSTTRKYWRSNEEILAKHNQSVHNCDLYPTDPSSLMLISSFTSAENSSGSSLKTAWQNPPIIAATAFSWSIPLCWK